ncbi:MAG: ABC transporter permease [Dehalococcoidia bacterium]|nr:ABC transporter permease [Dehalococcoidia bacterium]
MRQFIVVRLISMLFTLFGLSVLVFLLARLIPGDVVQVSLEQAERTPEMVQELRSFFGLDQPLYVQYWRWLSDVLQGDLGTSWRSGHSVMSLILDRLSVTAELTIMAMVVSIGLGVPLGIVAATRQNSFLDYLVRVTSMFSLSIPEFWQGIMLILVLSITLGWIPSLEYVDLWKDPVTNLSIMILPAVSVGTVASANIVRMTRATMLEELRQDYIRTARAKGLHDRVVIYSHALKNTLIPVVTIAGLQIGYLMGGIVVMEAVFTLPGVGRLMLLAISQRDYPLIQGVVLFIATIFVFSNLLVDVLYAYVNPRIRYG